MATTLSNLRKIDLDKPHYLLEGLRIVYGSIYDLIEKTQKCKSVLMPGYYDLSINY